MPVANPPKNPDDYAATVPLEKAATFAIDGEELLLSTGGAAELAHTLRQKADPDSVAAAVFIERLIEEPAGTENAPDLHPSESAKILLALLHMAINNGLSDEQQALHDALLAHHSQHG